MKSFVHLIVFAFIFESSGEAQQSKQAPQDAQGFLSRLPIWPSDGKPPAEYADKFFVYLDLATKEYVISYPQRLQTGQPDDGQRITIRYEPQNLVEPAISVAISGPSEGIFTYEYTVRNEAIAKRPIRWFSIVASSVDDSIKLEHPNWRPLLASPNVAPQAGLADGPNLRLRGNMGKFAAWSNYEVPEPLAPGRVVSSFRAKSSFLPGIVTSYANSGVIPQLPHPLPPEVSDQFVPLLAPERDFKVTLTIGPKFDPKNAPTADPVWIAGDFRLGLRALIYGRRLAKESPFVKEIDSLLEIVARGGAKIPIEFKATPSSELENEIAAAVRISLAP